MRIPSVITSGELLSRIRYHWDELIAYLRATRLVAGNGISISEHPTGTIISVNPQPIGGAGSAGGSSEYNGYFKIVDITDYTASPVVYKVMVVDGRSFNETTHTSGNMFAEIPEVNGRSEWISPFEITVQSDIVIYMSYSFFDNAFSRLTSPVNAPLSTSQSRIVYPIGSVQIVGGHLSISQTHTSGVLRFPVTAVYVGKFKAVINDALTQIKVIDGRNPASAYCGSTDIQQNIAVFTANLSSGSLYLKALYSSGAYSVSVTTSNQDTPSGSDKIAYLDVATVQQGGYIDQMAGASNSAVFGDYYYV